MKTFYWLVKREFWEHRGGFFWAPMITGGVFLLLNIMGIVSAEMFGMRHGFSIGMSGKSNLVTELLSQPMDQEKMAGVGAVLDMVMLSSSLLICMVLGFVVFFYFLGALYDERRDSSLLFWKSLPISDTATVLSKVVAGLVVAPIIALVIGVLAGIAMLLIFTITMSFHGVNLWYLLTLAHPFQVTSNLIASIPLYLLWALPSAGWLLLCSAWARSKPFLWAVVLPIAAGAMFSWFSLIGLNGTQTQWYWHNVVARILLSVFPGGWFTQNMRDAADRVEPNDPGQLLHFISASNAYSVLGSPGIWVGVLAGAAMLAGAIWFRRWRNET